MPEILDVSELSYTEKAAVVLLSMGEEIAAPVFRRLPEKLVRLLAEAVPNIQDLHPKVTEAVLREFHRELTSRKYALPKAQDYMEKLIDRSFEGDEAEQLKSQLLATDGAAFETLDEVDTRLLANIIQKEHPQTIALVLAHIAPARAAEVLALLPDELRGEVVYRIGRLDAVSSDILADVEQAILSEIKGRGSIGGRHTAGGVERIADILNQLDKATESQILEVIEDKNAQMAEEIRQHMFVFDDLVRIDDRGIQALLKEVENATLVLALKTASEEVRNKIFGNLSKRATELIKEDLEAMPPVRVSDVEQAQQTIVRLALKLEEEGHLTIAGGGGDVFV